MTTNKIGTITIGQAPRTDVNPILEKHLPADAECINVGVLDGLSHQEIEARFSPQEGDALLTTRLVDGSSVVIGKPAVQVALQQKISALEAQGCTIIALLCTGEFHGLTTQKALLVEPDRVIPPVMAALAGNHTVGVVVPLVAQLKSEEKKWAGLQGKAFYAPSSPYQGTVETLSNAVKTLLDNGAELIVMDCIGYTEHHRGIARQVCGNVPVVLSNSLLARLLAELL